MGKFFGPQGQIAPKQIVCSGWKRYSTLKVQMTDDGQTGANCHTISSLYEPLVQVS